MCSTLIIIVYYYLHARCCPSINSDASEQCSNSQNITGNSQEMYLLFAMHGPLFSCFEDQRLA